MCVHFRTNTGNSEKWKEKGGLLSTDSLSTSLLHYHVIRILPACLLTLSPSLLTCMCVSFLTQAPSPNIFHITGSLIVCDRQACTIFLCPSPDGTLKLELAPHRHIECYEQCASESSYFRSKHFLFRTE